MTLYIRLLGTAEISHDDTPLHLRGHKPLALLAYLLMTGKPHTRSHLVDLLYENSRDPRASLRWTLHQLVKKIGADFVRANRRQIGFNFDSDYQLDAILLKAGQSDLYRGDFLEGVYIRDAGGFMNWLLYERERLRDMCQAALIRQLERCEDSEDCQGVIQIAHQLIGLDNLREEWHRALMRAYVRQGKRKAALVQFERCRRLLKDELGVDPTGETQLLYKAIRSGHFDAGGWRRGEAEPVGLV